jgi:hypothetical protein
MSLYSVNGVTTLDHVQATSLLKASQGDVTLNLIVPAGAVAPPPPAPLAAAPGVAQSPAINTPAATASQRAGKAPGRAAFVAAPGAPSQMGTSHLPMGTADQSLPLAPYVSGPLFTLFTHFLEDSGHLRVTRARTYY